MPVAATRIVAVPPASGWTEERLVAIARKVQPPRGALRAGDLLGELVVVRVEPESGAMPDAATEMDILPTPRPTAGALHAAVLIDVSDSMTTPWDAGRTRLAAATEALRGFLASATAGAPLVTVLSYSKDVRLLAGPAPRDPALPLDVPPARGRSRTASALNATLAHLAAQSHDGPQAIVLLTDGAGELAELRVAGERARRLGVAVHVLSFAPAMDEAFVELARVTRGTTARASLPLTFDLPRGTNHG